MQEFIPSKEYYNIMVYKNSEDRFYRLVDPKIVSIAQFYRDYFGREVVINNWHTGGNFSLRGWRPQDTKIGARFSQHKLGKAFDCNIKGLSDREVYETILKNKELFYEKGVRRLEDIRYTTGWLHTDIKETNELKIFIP